MTDCAGTHEYVSTACIHGIHSRCIRSCKFCRAVCRCGCSHTPESEDRLRAVISAAVARAAQVAADSRPDADADEIIVDCVLAALRAMPPKEPDGGVR